MVPEDDRALGPLADQAVEIFNKIHTPEQRRPRTAPRRGASISVSSPEKRLDLDDLRHQLGARRPGEQQELMRAQTQDAREGIEEARRWKDREAGRPLTNLVKEKTFKALGVNCPMLATRCHSSHSLLRSMMAALTLRSSSPFITP